MTSRDDEERARRFAETAASLLSGGAGDLEPSRRLGPETVLAEQAREQLSEGLRPLPVRVETGADVGADLAIIGRLGQGGMAYVELARQHSLDREVALKFHWPAPSSTPSRRPARLPPRPPSGAFTRRISPSSRRRASAETIRPWSGFAGASASR